jgi:hypothetical protein
VTQSNILRKGSKDKKKEIEELELQVIKAKVDLRS